MGPTLYQFCVYVSVEVHHHQLQTLGLVTPQQYADALEEGGI